MSFSDDDDDDLPPPLEDMSDLVERVRNNKISQGILPGDDVPPKIEEIDVPYDISSQQSHIIEIPSNSATGDVVKSTAVKTTSKKKVASKGTGFGGMQKGFLFGGGPKKTKKPNNKARTDNLLPKKKPNTDDEDFILRPSVQKEDELKIPEVQAAMKDTSWINDDLLNNIQHDRDLMEKLENPKYNEALEKMKKSPKDAMEYYKDDTDVQEFFKKFYKILGNHFSGLEQNESVKTAPEPPDIITEEEAKMQATMQKILANPEIRDILAQPQVKNLFDCLRRNPDEAQSIFASCDVKMKADIQKLVNAGLLSFE